MTRWRGQIIILADVAADVRAGTVYIAMNSPFAGRHTAERRFGPTGPGRQRRPYVGSDMRSRSVIMLARQAIELDRPVPCRDGDSRLWFAVDPEDLELARVHGPVSCPLRAACLAGAIERREPCGVWGGRSSTGANCCLKRRRGRPHADRPVRPARAAAPTRATGPAPAPPHPPGPPGPPGPPHPPGGHGKPWPPGRTRPVPQRPVSPQRPGRAERRASTERQVTPSRDVRLSGAHVSSRRRYAGRSGAAFSR